VILFQPLRFTSEHHAFFSRIDITPSKIQKMKYSTIPILAVVKRMISEFLLRPFKLMLLLLVTTTSHAADVDVLIVEARSGFNGAEIRTQLQNILGGAGLGTVNVQLDNAYTSSYGSNLVSWYHETATDNETAHLAKLQKLRSEAGTQWDYIILLEERATIEKHPGHFCVGVSDIYKEIQRGAHKAELVLAVQWPTTVSTNRVNTIAYYGEVAYRVGNSLGVKVAPAGMAWDASGRPSGTTQKNKDAAYIAAATLYSQIWNKSAATSTYNYSSTFAQNAWTAVTNNQNATHYSGKFVDPTGIYNMGSVMDRKVGLVVGRDSSTEGMFAGNFTNLTREARLNDLWSSDGAFQYVKMVRPGDGIGAPERMYTTQFDWISHHSGTAIYSISNSVGYYLKSGADSYASQVSAGNTNWRHMPDRLMFVQYRRENNNNILAWVGGHMSDFGIRLRCSYMYTLRTGRCPIPGPARYGDSYWDAVRIGHETAWRLSTLQARVPGFKSLPSSRVSHTVDPESPATMQVYFFYPPRSNVTVTVSTDQPFATVSPQTLTFTPTNYNTPQTVTVSVAPGSVPTTPFIVSYNTSSADEVYDGLAESWRYQVNRRPTANNQTVAAYSGFPKQINFTGSDPDDALFHSHADAPLHYAESHGYRIITPPAHGTIKIFNRGDDCTYTPNPGYTGPDSFTFVRYDWGPDSVSNVATVSVNVTPQPLYYFNLIKNGDATLSPINEFYWTTQSGAWNGDSDRFNYTAAGLLYQDVDVSDYAFDIDGGRQFFTFNADWMAGDQWPPFDDFRFLLECRGESGQLLQTVDSGVLGFIAYGWQLYQRNVMPPVGTRTIRVIMKTTAGKKGYYADNLKLIAQSGLNEVPIADHQSGVVATSGVDNTITLTASDADGDALTYIIVNQPQHGTVTVNGTGPTVNYVPNADYLGPDSFSFKVNDLRDDSNVATVSTNVVANQAPTVTITSPTRDTVAIPYNVGVLLKATVFDDAKPAPATITWSKVSGPGTVTFESPNSADTAVSFNNVQGTYVLRLTVDDGQYSVSDTVTVEVGYYDTTKDMGPYVIVTAAYVGTPGVPIALDAVAIFDDGLPNPPGAVQIFWRQVSGPDGVILSSNEVQNPTATFPVDGAYVLRVSAFDGATETFYDVNATIGSGNLPPVAQNQTVEVNKNSINNSITLTSTDTENDPVTYAIVSQPLNGSVTLIGSGPQVTYTPTAGFGGNDSFTFKANDGKDSNVATAGRLV
jgi:hypothetical protein